MTLLKIGRCSLIILACDVFLLAYLYKRLKYGNLIRHSPVLNEVLSVKLGIEWRILFKTTLQFLNQNWNGIYDAEFKWNDIVWIWWKIFCGDEWWNLCRVDFLWLFSDDIVFFSLEKCVQSHLKTCGELLRVQVLWE